MLDSGQIGRTLPEVKGRVEPGRLRFFREVTGGGDITAAIPPTYLFSLALLDAERPLSFIEDLDIPLESVLHGEQRFTYHHPVRAGDELTFMTKVSDIFHKKGGALTFVVQDTEIRNQHDVHVAQMQRTLVVRNEGNGYEQRSE